MVTLRKITKAKLARLNLAIGSLCVLYAISIVPAWANDSLELCYNGCAPQLKNAYLNDSSHPTFAPWEVTLEASEEWPRLSLQPLAGHKWTWLFYNTLVITISNLDPRAYELVIKVESCTAVVTTSLQGRLLLKPMQSTTILLPLDFKEFGLKALPPIDSEGKLSLPEDVQGTVNLGEITAVIVSGSRDEPRHFRINYVQPVQYDWHQGLTGIFDTYGQYTRAIWPEKVESDEALVTKLAGSRLLVDGTLDAVSNEAGERATTAGRPHAFFQVHKRGRRWQLVAPDGRPFFSLGVNAVTPSGRTLVHGRDFMFAGLPGSDNELRRFLGPDPENREWFDIREANIERGLGRAWDVAWPQQTLRRLRAWGFNTIGNWSDSAVKRSGALPFVTTLNLPRGPEAVSVDRDHAIADPFGSTFPAAADAAAAAASAGVREDPQLIGYFGGNELPWRGIGRAVLAEGPSAPAKAALVSALRAKYGEAAKLAAAWGVPELQTWEAVSASVPLSISLTPVATTDLAAFEALFADRWFGTVAAAIKRHDPNHLFLGTRFAAFTPEAVRACAKWCDVLSFNIYAKSPEQSSAAALWRSMDKPVLIGEFHFGSTDRGNFWPGLVDVGSEEARAPAYRTYVAAAAADPNIVGCHWFEYADEPLTGRPGDGENGHIGLVGVTDIPWGGFIEGVAAANRDVLHSLGVE